MDTYNVKTTMRATNIAMYTKSLVMLFLFMSKSIRFIFLNVNHFLLKRLTIAYLYQSDKSKKKRPCRKNNARSKNIEKEKNQFSLLSQSFWQAEHVPGHSSSFSSALSMPLSIIIAGSNFGSILRQLSKSVRAFAISFIPSRVSPR